MHIHHSSFKKYPDYKFPSNQNQLKDKSDFHYIKLPYRQSFTPYQSENSKLFKEFCKENLDIKLVFSSFKVKNYFSYKEPIPNDFKSYIF